MKKITSKNQLETFNFHDCRIIEVKMKNNKFILNLDHVDVLTTNSQNSYSTAMSTDEAIVCFEDYTFINIIRQHTPIGGVTNYETIKIDDPKIVGMLKNSEINDCYIIKENEAEIGILNNTRCDFISVVLKYSSVYIEWDNFIAPSYFVGHEAE